MKRERLVKRGLLIVAGVSGFMFQIELILVLYHLWHNFFVWSIGIINQYDTTVRAILSLLLCPIWYILLIVACFGPVWLCNSIYRTIKYKTNKGEEYMEYVIETITKYFIENPDMILLTVISVAAVALRLLEMNNELKGE